MKRFEVVVARYNEDVGWLDFLDDSLFDIVLYNKGHNMANINHNIYKYIRLQDVGREANTFLYHIIYNYDNLRDYTVFLQGNPFDHCTNSYRASTNTLYTQKEIENSSYIDYLDMPNRPGFNNGYKFGRSYSFSIDFIKFINSLDTSGDGGYVGDAFLSEFNDRNSSPQANKFHNMVFSVNVPVFEFVAGAQYYVSRNAILNRSLRFYKKLYDISMIEPSFAWAMERYWYTLFFKKDVKVKDE